MATSSIYAEVRIDTPSKLESFLKALEQAEKNKENCEPPKSGIPMITDPDMIRQMFARRQQRENAARKEDEHEQKCIPCHGIPQAP